MAEYDSNQPRSSTWEGSPSELEKEKRRQDSLADYNDASQFPTIKSHIQSESSPQYTSRTPSYPTNHRRNKSISIEDLEAQLSIEELERPQTPTWDQTTTTKSTRKEGYQGWHLQFTPTHRPAVKAAYPQCYNKFDSRHWNEFPRPKGKRIKCSDCGQYLGYFRREVDLYGSGKAFVEGNFGEREYDSD